MKVRALSLLVAVAGVAVASQDPVSLVRTYREGEQDSFKMSVTASLALGTADISMIMNQTVKKVFENGDADIETKVLDMAMSLNGTPVALPESSGSSAQVRRLDKFGRPVGTVTSGQPAQMQLFGQAGFMRYIGFTGDKPLAVGASLDVDDKDAASGSRTWGKVTLSKLENGFATVITDLQMTNKDTGDKPMSMKFTSLIEASNAKLAKLEGEVTNLPPNEQGVKVDSVKVSMQRVK